MPDSNPNSSSARNAWEGIVQTPELVGYFEGLFDKLGIQVEESGEQFTVIHRGQAVEFVDGLEPDVDYVVTLQQENVDNLIAHAADGEIDPEESWQIIRVLFTPMTEATLKSPVLSSIWLRKLAGVEDLIHVHLLSPDSGEAAAHSLIYADGGWSVRSGLHGKAERSYRLTPDQALDYQRRIFEAARKNSMTGWLSFTRWYKSWREHVSTTI